MLKTVKEEVKGRLEQSLHNQVLMSLPKEAGGKLLILGAPGCGKTTTLLQLAKKLLKDAEKDVNQGIPIILELAAWQPVNKDKFWNKKLEDPTIYEWLITQLSKKYTNILKNCIFGCLGWLKI